MHEEQFHNLTPGESQGGKSFVLTEIATKLFPSISEVISTLSPQGLKYVAKNNPQTFKHRLIVVDELKDNQEAARLTLKLMASRGQKRSSARPWTIKKQAQELVIEGMPTVWAASMEVIKDPGGQISNRLFKTQVDESREQSERVERFQKDRMAFGDLRTIESTVDRARRLLERIMKEKDFTALNPFSEYIEQTGYSVRNHLPSYHALLSSITYAHRFARPRFDLSDGRRHLIATLADNLTAMRLWAKFSGSHTTGLPPRHQRLLEAMKADKLYTPEDATAEYNARWHGEYTEIGSKTIYNYLKELSDRNLVTSERRVENRGGYEAVTKEFVYRKMPGDLPTISQLYIRMGSYTSFTHLDAWVIELREMVSNIPGVDQGLLDGLGERLVDAAVPIGPTTQAALPESEDESSGDGKSATQAKPE